MKGLVGLLVAALLLSPAACVNLKPGRCDHDSDCLAGSRCNLDPTPQGNGRCVLIAPGDGGDGGDAMPSTDGGADKTGDGTPSDVSGEKPEAGAPCTVATCSGAKPICDGTSKVCRACSSGGECAAVSSVTAVCSTSGACVECETSGQCGTATNPICDTASSACRACGTGAECAARDPSLPACAPSGKCLECVMNADCKTAGKPICDPGQNVCRACQADSECPADPGVCMTDGHCATSGEVIFVENVSTGCAAADGSSAKPYCTPGEGVAQLSANRRVLIIRGIVLQTTLGTSGVSPVIVGRKSSTGDDGTISAVSDAALTISNDNVLVRDLSLRGGLGVNAKGLVVTGASATVTLLRMTVALGTGLGVDAESGATLSMDQCYVQNNSAGGILVNGAKYDIQNSVIASNGGTTGYGVQFSMPKAASRFSFNTVIANPVAATCDLNNAQSLVNSIVVGPITNCTIANSLTTAPTFSAAKPFHLTAHLACPTAPTTFPDRDVDSDPRVAPIDCGADQFVP